MGAPLVLATCESSGGTLYCTDKGNVSSLSLENYTDPTGHHTGFYLGGWGNEGPTRTTVMRHLPEHSFRGLNVSLTYIIADWQSFEFS